MSKTKGGYRFSVVIPCYNEADFIADTLGSLKAQDTAESYEIIIVDNNCTDKTVDIAKQYGVKVVTEKRVGVCAARQAGTKAAKGEIVISTDADTTFSPNWLSTIDNAFRNNTRLVAVGGPCRYIDGPWWGKIYTHILFTGSYAYSLVIGHPFYMTATNIAFLKSAWKGYDLKAMQGGDELDLLHKLRQQGRVKFNNSNPTYTSGRRLTKGLFYSIFVSFLYYYLAAYYIDRIFNRAVIGSAPAFRQAASIRANPSFRFTFILVAVLATTMVASPMRKFMSDNYHDAAYIIRMSLQAIS